MIRGIRDGIETLAVGALLGCADRRTLHRLDAAFYRALPDYRDDAHNLRGLMAWETAALACFPPAGRVVVVGAGGGRETIALAGAGYSVVAYECNAALLRVAERLLPRVAASASIRFLPRDEPPPAGEHPFDAAIIGWSTYMLMMGRDVRIRFLRGVRTTLRTGAPLLLSFFTRDDNDERLARIARYAGTLRRALGGPPVEAGDDLAPAFVHRFTQDEVRAELHAGGFRMQRFEAQGAGPEDSGWAVALAVHPAQQLASDAPAS